jgi:ribosomal protein L7/L12
VAPASNFIKSDLAATVAAYTPSLHEAPRVIGKRLAVIGRSLRKQKKLRALANYDIREEMGLVEAKQHIETSKQLMGDLRRIGPKP